MAERPGAGPPGPGFEDLAEVSARFGAALRRAGLPAGLGRCERFAAAVTVVRPATLRALYLCAQATLASSRDEADVLRAVFGQVFGAADGVDGPAELDELAQDPAAARPARPQAAGPAEERAADDLLARAAGAARTQARSGAGEPGAERDDPADPQIAHPYLGSTVDRLAAQDFAELSDAELRSLAGLMRGVTLALPLRRSRRDRRRPGGPRTDLRSTLRRARRTGGQAFDLIGRSPGRRPRRLVVLCDISGSMEPYARAMIQLLYCAAGGARAEVFSFATRLTRLTPALARSQPGVALDRAGKAAPDWRGGTRIGAALREFNDSWGRRGMARGAVILIVSDGWDTGDPAILRREMERLSRVAFRIIWVNPRTKNAGYQPLAGGMAAAWPHCDAVVSAHTVEALSQLTAALADPARHRVSVSPAPAAATPDAQRP
jgi:uncharacterized protein with von Willebrand factor type A (vWA) domain